eukprot:COSAG01_NODE_6261_length_3765_cov_4.144299_4_plen_165_part_00
MPTRLTSASACRCVKIDYHRRRAACTAPVQRAPCDPRAAAAWSRSAPSGEPVQRQGQGRQARLRGAQHRILVRAPRQLLWPWPSPWPSPAAAHAPLLCFLQHRVHRDRVARAAARRRARNLLSTRLDPLDERHVQCHTAGGVHHLAVAPVAAVAAMPSSALRSR